MINDMKRMFLVCMVIFLSVGGFAQTEEKVVSPKENGLYQLRSRAYAAAMRYNDLPTATSALYDMILLDPQDPALMDSLALLYFESRQFTSAVLISNDIVAQDPNNKIALEINAVSFENLGIADKALLSYEALYLKQNNLFTLYKVAALQVQLKRLEEAKTSADIIIKDIKSSEAKLVFNGKDQKQQEIPMSAAAYNIKGLAAKEDGDKKLATKMYKEALKIQPDFELAQNNLDALSK